MFDSKEYKKEWRKNNCEKIKEYNRKRYKKNHDKIREQIKKWQEDNHEKNKELHKKYYQMHREKFIKKAKEYYKNNREKILKAISKNNPEKVKEWNRRYAYYKYKIDLKFNLNCRMRRSITKSLKGNKPGRYWETLIGYTLEDLIKQLKRTMPEGYIWQDYLEGKLELDHIIPISAFNFNKSEHTDFRRCWALSNLRLISAIKNTEKGNKLEKPFQPALRI